VRAILALACACAWPPSSAAASPVDAQIQAARELFQQAEKDEDAGLWSDALVKFKRVAEVKSTAGVRYHEALCEEHLGQIATAFTDYTSAENQARAEGAQDVLRLVGKQIKDLGPRVPRLTVHVVPDVADAQVKLDGVPVAHALLGVAMPVDPGVHRIDAEAPGRQATSATVTVLERDATVLDVALTAPAPLPSPLPLPVAPAVGTGPQVPGPSSSPPTAALATTIGAVALAGGGVAAFLLAGNAQAGGQRDCAAVVSTSAGACDSERTTVRAWDFSAAGMWVGAAGLAAVSVLLWTSRGHTTSTAIDVGPASVVVRGRF
jgi:hypothetical protein